jgi:hypothetical protein
MKNGFAQAGFFSFLVLALVGMSFFISCGANEESAVREGSDDDDDASSGDDDDDEDVNRDPWWDAPKTDEWVQGDCGGVGPPPSDGGGPLNPPILAKEDPPPPPPPGDRGYEAGEKIANFKIEDVDGKEWELYDLLASKPVVLEFGSFT